MTVNFCELRDNAYPYLPSDWVVSGEFSATGETEDDCYREIWCEHERRMRYLNDMKVKVEDKYAKGYQNWCANMSILDYYGNATID